MDTQKILLAAKEARALAEQLILKADTIITEIETAPRQAVVLRDVNVRSGHTTTSPVLRLMKAPQTVTVYEEWKSLNGLETWVRHHATAQEWSAMVYNGTIFMEYL
ncbi:MAG: SH3 domain-containing protein [Chloroflexota bacterium]